MKSKNLVASLVVSFSLFQALSFAADTADKKIEIGGMAAIENGQLVKSDYLGEVQKYRPWVNDEYARISLQATLSDHLQLIVAPEIRIWFSNNPWDKMANAAFSYPFVAQTTASLADAEGILSYGDKENISFEFAAGVMPYKYDLEAKNLGEYLFRTGVHPAFIMTSFDGAYATLTGFRLSSTMLNKISLDLLLTTETEFMPTLDWSVSFLAGYKPFPLLDIGAGVMLDRLWPMALSNAVQDPSFGPDNQYLSSTGETQFYTFGGTKLVGRVCIDPKAVLPASISDIFGKEDGKIYGEAAILGVKSITAYMRNPANPSQLIIDSSKNYYSDITQRIPVMFGFNIPTFNGFFNSLGGFWRSLMLDYLSVELEWYGWPYPDAYGYMDQFKILYPEPPPTQNGTNPLLYKNDDNWKYSFNFRKTVTKGFSIIGQIARDHTHNDTYDQIFDAQNSYVEAFSEKDEWGWWVKLQYNF